MDNHADLIDRLLFPAYLDLSFKLTPNGSKQHTTNKKYQQNYLQYFHAELPYKNTFLKLENIFLCLQVYSDNT